MEEEREVKTGMNNERCLPVCKLISPLRRLEIIQFLSQGLHALRVKLSEESFALLLLLQLGFHLIQDLGCLSRAGGQLRVLGFRRSLPRRVSQSARRQGRRIHNSVCTF